MGLENAIDSKIEDCTQDFQAEAEPAKKHPKYEDSSFPANFLSVASGSLGVREKAEAYLRDYLGFVSVEKFCPEAVLDSCSNLGTSDLGIHSAFLFPELTWLDTMIVSFLDLLPITTNPEENLVYLDFSVPLGNSVYPFLNGKKLAGVNKCRVYSDFQIPVSKSGRPMFSNVCFDFGALKLDEKLTKILLVTKLLAKTYGSYANLVECSQTDQGRQDICYRLTGGYLQEIQSRQITKLVTVLGMNMETQEPSAKIPIILI